VNSRTDDFAPKTWIVSSYFAGYEIPHESYGIDIFNVNSCTASSKSATKTTIDFSIDEGDPSKGPVLMIPSYLYDADVTQSYDSNSLLRTDGSVALDNITRFVHDKDKECFQILVDLLYLLDGVGSGFDINDVITNEDLVIDRSIDANPVTVNPVEPSPNFSALKQYFEWNLNDQNALLDQGKYNDLNLLYGESEDLGKNISSLVGKIERMRLNQVR
jgi:hypothetical protein